MFHELHFLYFYISACSELQGRKVCASYKGNSIFSHVTSGNSDNFRLESALYTICDVAYLSKLPLNLWFSHRSFSCPKCTKHLPKRYPTKIWKNSAAKRLITEPSNASIMIFHWYFKSFGPFWTVNSLFCNLRLFIDLEMRELTMKKSRISSTSVFSNIYNLETI